MDPIQPNAPEPNCPENQSSLSNADIDIILAKLRKRQKEMRIGCQMRELMHYLAIHDQEMLWSAMRV